MAFDHNSIAQGLRPLNIARTVAEEPYIVPVTTAITTSGRNIDGVFPNPVQNVGSPSAAIPVYYPTADPDSGFVGLGYGNPMQGVPGWCQRVPVPAAVTTVGQAEGTSNMGTNVGIGFCCNNPNLGNQGSGNSNDLTSDEGGDNSSSGKKIKFMCSFGGKILPRPSDGNLRYVGGQTRIISVRRDICFNELVQKMTDTCGQPIVIKYQLPEEDLDALVSVSCSDDLENMMDEYEKLAERLPDGLVKLRMFLFSPSECVSSGVIQQGDLRDSGQRYVDAVNGIMDGVSVGITRKESIASAASTQNSDLSGSEAVDSLGPAGDVNVTGPPATSMTYLGGNSTSSHENTPRLACVEPTPVIYTDSSAIPLGIHMAKPGLSLPASSHPDVEVEKSVPLTLQQQQVAFDSKPPVAEVPPPVPYLQSYVSPHQEAMGNAGYLHLPSQMGLPRPQLFGTPGSVLPRHQLPENPVAVMPRQYIPSAHMSTMPPSNVVLRPNFVQRQMQPPPVRMENYHDSSIHGSRFVQVPVDHSCRAYQAQVPPSVVGGGYGLHQVPPPGHVLVSDGLVSHQQATFPENILRMEDCYMCQKALPHAHSDPLTQEQRDSIVSSMSDMNSIYHSLHVEDMRGRPMNRVVVTSPLGKGSAEGAGVQTRVISQMDKQVMPPQSQPVEFSPNIQAKHENAKVILPKTDNLDYPRMPVPQGVVGLAVQAPRGVILNNIPQSSQEDYVQQPGVPSQFLVKQDVFVNKAVYSETPPVGSVAVQPKEYLVSESPKDNSGQLFEVVPKEEMLQSSMSSENLKRIDERMEALRVCPLEDIYNMQHSKSDKSRNGDMLGNKPQQISDRNVKMFLDNTFTQSNKPKQTNQIKVTNPLPCSSAEISYLHSFHPIESCEVAQQPIVIDPGSFPQSDIGVCMASNEVFSGNPASSATHSYYITNPVSPVSEWKDDASHCLPTVFPSALEAVTSNGHIPSSVSASDRIGDIQDSSNSLFSNQDPWNLQHSIHLSPPKPRKVTIEREVCGVKAPFTGNYNVEVNTEGRKEDEIHLPSGNMNRDFKFEHDHSGKGSAEERIKQQLQTVAEGVAASVLHSATSSNPDFYVHQASGSLSERNQNRAAQDIDVEEHQSQLEDIKAKVSEKINLGFPVSDGLGRLQIINNGDLEELRELGSGTFGTVYHGKWRGTDVAIKRINDRCFAGKPSEQERMREDFWNEAIKLADLHHPNVVAFYGVVLDGPGGSVATVTEFMINGSLRNALEKNERNLDKRKRLLIAMDVAFGMEYLHGKNIVHFDLKSDNLLVNLRDPHRPICKVGDLGLSKVKCHTLISGGVRGTLPWMAPELLNGSSALVSEKVDVFSFGIVLWELLTGEEPYANLHYGAIIGGIVSNTLRPPVPGSCDAEWRSMMERCWSAEPSERPNFTEIANQLRTMASKIPPKGQTQQ